MPKKDSLIKIIITSAVFLAVVFIVGNYFIWSRSWFGHFYPGVVVGGLNLSGKTPAEAEAILKEKADEIIMNGLSFNYQEKSATLPINTFSFDSDLAGPLLSFDLKKTLNLAQAEQGQNSFGNYLLLRWKIKKINPIVISYFLDFEKIKAFLNDQFPELIIEPVNAHFSLSSENPETGGLTLKTGSEKIGKEINYEALAVALTANLSKLENAPLFITTHSKYPSVATADLAGLEATAREILDRGSLFLRLPDQLDKEAPSKTWEIKPEELITWLGADRNAETLNLFLIPEKICQYLESSVAPEINLAAIVPRLEIKDGRASNWQAGQDGRELDLDKNVSLILNEFLNNKNEIILEIEIIPSESLFKDGELKIKEIIGTGHSNYAGSPANRRHNISVGAASLHGVLIKPNEEFSLLAALGEINGETGYRQELVIKGDKTVPEYGGGLCQIGTTVFRAALASGLPITERRNHSYRVSYYEPAGTDATIYDPAPDVRFVNDTGNYILIQARLDGNDLYFDFWGIKDGREITITDPTIYNIVKPAPTKIIETDSLAPGVKKCTESSHNGADAYFDYTVVYPEGATTTPLHEVRFSSHYVPWQAVCLIGKEPAEETVNEEEAETEENNNLENPPAAAN
ncbi:MAG: VanW family protein [Patescibacteria group bacterium]